MLRLGDYEMLEEIARGGMGVVYRARQLSLNRIVALKVLLHGCFSSADFLRRFRREAEVVAALRHPNIVSIYEIGEHDGDHFLSLEYIEGQSFAELAREHPLPARRAAGYLRTIAQAVDYAHQRGVLHRDLKPSNILLDTLDFPHVTDFGLAKLASDNGDLTITGQVLGSPNYMPPEQAAGKFAEVSARSDVYSLGAILYQLITGRPPFQGETLQSVLSQLQDAEPLPPRRLNPGIPADLQTICLKCLRKEPARRYATAAELADDLDRFLENKPIHARAVPLVERATLWCRRRPLLAAVSAGLVATVILGVSGVLWEWRQAESHAKGELSQRLIAEKNEARMRVNLYAADVAMASQAWQGGNFGLARLTLSRLVPQPGEKDLRGFEWRYLWDQCRGQQSAVLTGHKETVMGVAYSPDGRHIASSSQDGTVIIYDATTRATITNLMVARRSVWTVDFTADGKWLVAGSSEGVTFWNTISWRREKRFDGGLAALSKSGDLLVTSDASPFFWEPGGAVVLWNWRTGKELHRFKQPGRAVALSPDGRLVAVAGPASGLGIWDIEGEKVLRRLTTKSSAWSLSFSPDSTHLLAACWSPEVLLWNLHDDSPAEMLSGHRFHAWSAKYSEDGSTIVTVGSDQTVRLWDAGSLEPKAVLHGHNSEVWCAAFSPNGSVLATGGKDNNVLLWPVAPASSEEGPAADVDFKPLFSLDGKWMATVRPETGKSILWNSTNLSETVPVPPGQIIGFSREGNCSIISERATSSLQFWPAGKTVQTKRVVLEGAPKGAEPEYEGFSPDHEFYFAINHDGFARVWNVETGRLTGKITTLAPPIRHAVLSPQGRLFAVSVERDTVVHLYDCFTGAEKKLGGHRDFVSGMDFSPDGATLATGSVDGTIRLWNTARGECSALLPGHLQETSDVAFSPDGRTLASVGRMESVKLWNLATLREVVSEDITNAGGWLAFSPDGIRLAVTTKNNRLKLLEAPPK